MKKNKLCLPLMAAVLLASCAKQDKSPAGSLTAVSKMSSTSSIFTYYTYGTDITEDDFLKNAHDANDEKFNYVNHAMTLGLLEMSKNPRLLSSLVQQIDAKVSDQLNLYTFADNNDGVDAIMNRVFSERFRDFASFESNWRKYVEANYKYDVSYVPFARFINQTDVDINQVPYYSEPLDIDEQKFTQFNNNLPLWITSSSAKAINGFEFSTIDEKMSFNIHNPVIAIVNGHLNDDNLVQLAINKGIRYNGGVIPPPVSTMSCNLNPLPQGHVHEAITQTQFRIDNPYEGGDNNTSEYFVQSFYYRAYKAAYPIGWNAYGPQSSGGAEAFNHAEYDVPRSSIGTTITWSYDLFTPDYYDNGACLDLNFFVQSQAALQLDRYFLFAAYERDWGNTGKFLGGCYTDDPYNTGYYGQYGNRKYDSEWYFLNPWINMGYPVGACSYPSPSFPIWNPRNPTPNSTYISYDGGEVHLVRHNL